MVQDMKLDCPGADLYQQMYRNEQRMWTILLQVPGVGTAPPPTSKDTSDHPIGSFCYRTGTPSPSAASIMSMSERWWSLR